MLPLVERLRELASKPLERGGELKAPNKKLRAQVPTMWGGEASRLATSGRERHNPGPCHAEHKRSGPAGIAVASSMRPLPCITLRRSIATAAALRRLSANGAAAKQPLRR